MCGIVGYWNKGGANKSTITQMAFQLHHRGPDDAGVLIDEKCGLALGHQRLSIIDLSIAGHQPMVSPCGRFAIVFNGEIYNHMDLRLNLEEDGGHFDWKGHSDTETLLAGLRHWGILSTLKRLNGMFAFALWDNIDQTLFLARDRVGEKPLYYGKIGNIFFFGSELKCFYKHPNWHGDIDRNALSLYLRHNYIPTPWSIYKGIYKLPPAHFITIQNFGESISAPECYWDLCSICEDFSAKPNSETIINLTDQLDSLLNDSIALRMVADVPLGTFLSGGIDSSLVTAIMQNQSKSPIKTFTIGFHENKFDEAPHARSIAKYLGTDHTELYVSPKDALSVIPKLPTIWDEPFSDSSQIPTYLVSRMTRQYVTVSLSGDGGDELFFGYNRYSQAYQIWRIIHFFPKYVLKMISLALVSIPNLFLTIFPQDISRTRYHLYLIDRLPKLAGLLKKTNCDLFYQHFISHWKDPELIVKNSKEPNTVFTQLENLPNLDDFREKMMYIDTISYLPDDILTKVDRASMAVSLEARVPLLDHRIVEFAWKVPMFYKHRKGEKKWLLREVLSRYLPNDLINYPKMGFGVPIDQWLRGSLRDWAEHLIDRKRLIHEGFFNPDPIRRMWNEHVNATRRWHYNLWNVLMFQAWFEVSNHID